MSQKLPRVLVIYTGGTFGMESRSAGREGALKVSRLSPPALKRRILEQVPQIQDLARCDIDIFLNRDSAHVGPSEWLALAERIRSRSAKVDGVVVLHGTDTLHYTASALSFLLRPCPKPVVLTGAQLPLASILTDARRNFLSAVEVAANGPRPLVSQVTVLFDDVLLRGNRSRKRSAADFDAFESAAAPPLAEVGTKIRYADSGAVAGRRGPGSRRTAGAARLEDAFNLNVAMVHVTPGMPSRALAESLLPRIDALVLSVFSSGTAPTHDPEFVRLLRRARELDLPVVAVTEAVRGGPGTYEAGRRMLEEGCLWAGAMTPECAYVKTAWIAAQDGARTRAGFARIFRREYAGEGAR